MFEKEAEENAKQFIKTHSESDDFINCKRETDNYNVILAQGYELGFRKGTEFGYNKANEWHYVKDGDYPKAYQECYFIYSNFYGEDNKVIFSKSCINVLTGVYAFVIDEESDEETTEPCFYDDINGDEIDLKEVYAWKEIVLPKEIE